MMAQWRKSSYSGSSNDEMCIEVAELSEGVAIRDSKNLHGGRLTVARGEFGTLLRRIKAEALDGR